MLTLALVRLLYPTARSAMSLQVFALNAILDTDWQMLVPANHALIPLTVSSAIPTLFFARPAPAQPPPPSTPHIVALVFIALMPIAKPALIPTNAIPASVAPI